MDYLIKESTLTGIADAIREKTGGTGNLTTEGIKTGIGEVYDKGFADGKAQGGGGGGSTTAVPMKDVNFYDYDGTRLYSYTVAEAQALSELPPLPTREGLICQGWNYDLDTIKAYNRAVDVGATYITDDGKTRLYITIAAEGRMDVPLRFSQTVENGVTIDWGDGSATQTLSGTGSVTTTHTYACSGDYVISFSVADGCALGLGYNAPGSCVMGGTAVGELVYCNMLRRVEIGNGIKTIDRYAFHYCCSLRSVVIPNSVTSIGIGAFNYCHSIASVVIPNGVTRIDDGMCNYCYALISVIMPNSVTSIVRNAFYYCYALANVVIPKGVTSIGNYAFEGCRSLVSVVMPKSVSLSSSLVFSNCAAVAFYDFTAYTSIPTLSNTSVFSGIPSDCEIRVPAALYDEWIAATNWSTYASKIVAV